MIHDQSCKCRSARNSYASFLCSLFTRTFWQAVGTCVDYSTIESSKHSRIFSWKLNAPWGRLLSKVYRVQLKFPTEISPHLQIRISFGFKAALINRKCSAQLMTTDFLANAAHCKLKERQSVEKNYQVECITKPFMVQKQYKINLVWHQEKATETRCCHQPTKNTVEVE